MFNALDASVALASETDVLIQSGKDDISLQALNRGDVNFLGNADANQGEANNKINM